MRINLELGDPSHDGHGKTDIITIESNFNKKQIEEAYEIGIEKIGVDLINDVATEYEDNRLSKEYYKLFVDVGLDWDLSDYAKEELKNEEGLRLDSDDFAKLYLLTVKIGNPEFKYEIINSWDYTIDIGGYGLFGS